MARGRKPKRPFGQVREQKSRAKGGGPTVYYARYTGPDGEEYPAPYPFHTAADADAWLAPIKAAIERLYAGKPDPWTPPPTKEQREAAERTVPTIAEFFPQALAAGHLKKRKDLSEATVCAYQRRFKNHVEAVWGDVRVDQVTDQAVVTWDREMQRQGVSAHQRTNAYLLLLVILKHAVKAGYELHVPQIEGFGTQPPGPEINIAEEDEVWRIVREIPGERQLAVVLAVWCQLRIGEVIALRRSAISLKRQILRVRANAVRVPGKWLNNDPKSQKGKRDITIPQDLMPMVREHLERHAAPGRDGYLFPAWAGGVKAGWRMTGRHLSDSTIRETFKKAAEKVERGDLRYHDLRHTGATWFAMSMASGRPTTIPDLMDRLGHASPRAAMRYQHATGRDRALADAMPGLGGKVIPLSRKRDKGGRRVPHAGHDTPVNSSDGSGYRRSHLMSVGNSEPLP